MPCTLVDNYKLIGSLDAIDEVIIGVLNSMQYGQLHYDQVTRLIHGIKRDTEPWGTHTYHTDLYIEVRAKLDQNPPLNFAQLTNNSPHAQPLVVTVQHEHRPHPQWCTRATDVCYTKVSEFIRLLKERCVLSLQELANAEPATDYGSAKWADANELARQGYFSDGLSQDELSKRLHLGIFQGQEVSTPERFTEAHALVTGPPGVGKSRRVLITNLLKRLKISSVVTEVTGRDDAVPIVYSRTAGARKAHGHTILFINPSDRSSTRFNIVDFIHNESDATAFADLIIDNTTVTTHKGDQIWTQAEKHVLKAMLLYAMGLRGENKKSIQGGRSNLAFIRYLLGLGPDNCRTIVTKSGFELAVRRYDEFLNNSSHNFRYGVYSGLLQRLNPWTDPVLASLTEVSDFNVDSLSEDLYSVYLAYPVHRQEYKQFMALALNFFMQFPMLKQPQVPIAWFLDEFSAYGVIPGIQHKIAVMRNAPVPIVLGFQDPVQLKDNYTPGAAAFIGDVGDTKIFFATGNTELQKRISAMLGNRTAVRRSITSNCSIARHPYAKPLLDPSEVGRIPKDKIVVWRNGMNPILLDSYDPSFGESFFSNYPPPENPQWELSPTLFELCELAKKSPGLKDVNRIAYNEYARIHTAWMDAQLALENAQCDKQTTAEDLHELQIRLDECKKKLEDYEAKQEAIHNPKIESTKHSSEPNEKPVSKPKSTKKATSRSVDRSNDRAPEPENEPERDPYEDDYA